MATTPVPIVLLNPTSGGGNLEERKKMILQHFPDLGHSIHVSKSGDDLQNRAVAAAIEKRPLYVSGGDGTLVLVLNALIKAKLTTPILFLGTGSSNDIANHLGIKEINGALQSLQKKPEKLDIGRISGEEIEQTHFLGQVNLGLGALVNHYVEQKKQKHSWAYKWQNLVGAYAIWRFYRKKRVAFHAEITLSQTNRQNARDFISEKNSVHSIFTEFRNNKLYVAGRFDIVLAANIRYWAGGKEFAPGAKLNDNYLHLLLVQAGNFWRMARLITRAGKNGFTAPQDSGTYQLAHGVYLIPFQIAEIRLAKAGMVQADGDLLTANNEPQAVKTLTIDIVPSKIPFYCNNI